MSRYSIIPLLILVETLFVSAGWADSKKDVFTSKKLLKATYRNCYDPGMYPKDPSLYAEIKNKFYLVKKIKGGFQYMNLDKDHIVNLQVLWSTQSYGLEIISRKSVSGILKPCDSLEGKELERFIKEDLETVKDCRSNL